MPVKSIHRIALDTSTAISRYYVKNFIPPIDVIELLNNAGVRFLLLGAHGLAGWMGEGRGTQDVDVLVATRGYKKTIRTLKEAYPDLQVEDHEVVTRFRNPENRQVLIDVLKPNQPLLREALNQTHLVKTEKQTYRVPSLEMALTLKFAPMITLNRADEKKYQDAHDFILMVKNNPDLDLAKLAHLGELVYPGGGQEIVEKVQQVRAGKKLQL